MSETRRLTRFVPDEGQALLDGSVLRVLCGGFRQCQSRLGTLMRVMSFSDKVAALEIPPTDSVIYQLPNPEICADLNGMWTTNTNGDLYTCSLSN